jgi:hypothetical protein
MAPVRGPSFFPAAADADEGEEGTEAGKVFSCAYVTRSRKAQRVIRFYSESSLFPWLRELLLVDFQV